MPVLPLIDLMLLSGWTALFVGFVLKAIHLTTSYRPTIVGLTPFDFLLIAVAAMLFAIALAARTWVKSQEPAVTAVRRQQETLDAWRALRANGGGSPEPPGSAAAGSEEVAGSAAAVTPEEVLAGGSRRTS